MGLWIDYAEYVTDNKEYSMHSRDCELSYSWRCVCAWACRSYVLHDAHGHRARNQCTRRNVRLPAADESPAVAYVYIYIYIMMTYGMVHIDVDQPSHTSVVRECHLYHMHQCWQLASAHVCSVYDSTYNGDNRVASTSLAYRDRSATVSRSPESPPHGTTGQGYPLHWIVAG